MAKAHTLQGTDYGINRYYPGEIVKALSRLWADYKETNQNIAKAMYTLVSQLSLSLMVRSPVTNSRTGKTF